MKRLLLILGLLGMIGCGKSKNDGMVTIPAKASPYTMMPPTDIGKEGQVMSCDERGQCRWIWLHEPPTPRKGWVCWREAGIDYESFCKDFRGNVFTLRDEVR